MLSIGHHGPFGARPVAGIELILIGVACNYFFIRRKPLDSSEEYAPNQFSRSQQAWWITISIFILWGIMTVLFPSGIEFLTNPEYGTPKAKLAMEFYEPLASFLERHGISQFFLWVGILGIGVYSVSDKGFKNMKMFEQLMVGLWAISIGLAVSAQILLIRLK